MSELYVIQNIYSVCVYEIFMSHTYIKFSEIYMDLYTHRQTAREGDGETGRGEREKLS
jgi:hypothetical protein